MKENTETKWLQSFYDDDTYKHYTFKTCNNTYARFGPFASMIDHVPMEEFITTEPDRLPLLLGTQFGISPTLNSLPEEFHSKSRIIAIVSKSALSGVIFGLIIYRIQKMQMEKIKTFRCT